MKLVVENQQVNEYHKMEEDLYRNMELFQVGRTSVGKKNPQKQSRQRQYSKSRKDDKVRVQTKQEV